MLVHEGTPELNVAEQVYAVGLPGEGIVGIGGTVECAIVGEAVGVDQAAGEVELAAGHAASAEQEQGHDGEKQPPHG